MRILIVCFLGIVLCGCKEGEVQITNVQTEYVDFFSLLQKDIDEKWDSLRSAGYELAQLSARMTEGPVTLISPTLRRAFTSA